MKIVNISCLINLSSNLDLNFLELFLENAKLDQSPLNVLIMKINGATILLFKTGKGVISGAKTKTQAHKAAKMLVSNLRNCQYDKIRLITFKITNIVISTHLKHNINLEEFYKHNKTHASYEIEIFPGLIYKEFPKISSTIFRKGTFFVTGFNNFKLAKNYVHSLYQRLMKFAIK